MASHRFTSPNVTAARWARGGAGPDPKTIRGGGVGLEELLNLWDRVIRLARARFDAEFSHLTGLSGSRVYNVTTSRLNAGRPDFLWRILSADCTARR